MEPKKGVKGRNWPGSFDQAFAEEKAIAETEIKKTSSQTEFEKTQAKKKYENAEADV